jgi:molybdopterin-guanine dinucleotide biosynthesis protein A
MEGGGRAGETHAAGFVLVRGRCSRMGRDKAFLPAGSRTLAEQIAHSVRQAAGNVTLIGVPKKYASLGLPVIADVVKGRGPMGGIYTALLHSEADWNLVVACDMPGLEPDFLRALIQAAWRSPQSCLVCDGPGGIEPLCAVYHRRLLPPLESALEHKQLRMKDFVLQQNPERWPVADASALRNINTPEEWRQEVA